MINKIDRPEARVDEVYDEVLELFMELDATDEQLDSPFVFASANISENNMPVKQKMKKAPDLPDAFSFQV